MVKLFQHILVWLGFKTADEKGKELGYGLDPSMNAGWTEWETEWDVDSSEDGPRVVSIKLNDTKESWDNYEEVDNETGEIR